MGRLTELPNCWHEWRLEYKLQLAFLACRCKLKLELEPIAAEDGGSHPLKRLPRSAEVFHQHDIVLGSINLGVEDLFAIG